MKIALSQDTPCQLRVTLGFAPCTRVFCSLIGLGFVISGSIIAFVGFPHTEILRAERHGNRFICTRAQALADRWEFYTRTIVVGADARCELKQDEDTWQAIIRSHDGNLPFGKSKPDLTSVQESADKVNAFFAERDQPRLEIRDAIWWWWALPFSLIPLAIGLLLLGWMNHYDVWLFDRGSGEVRRFSQCIRLWRHRQWLWRDVKEVAIFSRDDSDGTFHNLRLTFIDGTFTEMCCHSPSGSPPPKLEEAARRMNEFLRIPPPNGRYGSPWWA